MVPFQLTVLGAPQLQAPDGEQVRFRTRKHFALLIYLAIEPSIPHRRDRLATLLWPDVEIDRARHSLATALTWLRARLSAEAFDANRDTVQLMPGTIVSDSETLVRDQPTDGSALQLGPFLEEFDVDNAPGFQLWKDTQRARLLPLLHGTLTERIELSRRRGDSRAMESLAQRLLRIDDLSEEATRAQLETRAMAGDRIGALRLFDRWRARLDEELGAAPTPVIDRLAQRLRRNRWDHASTIGAPVRIDSAQDRPYVGRGSQFMACYQVWERAREGEPSHLLLRGETGIGKTTLIDRLTTSLSLEGATITRVKCYQLERELPFAVVVGLLNHLLDLPGASATAPEHLAELGRLVSKVRQRYAALPDPLPSMGESARMLFTEAVVALVAAVADEHPVVLVVDDIHLADATSLAVLHLMLRRVEQLPLMVILTSSSALRSETPEARRFVDSTSLLALTEIHLDPLNDDEADELVTALTARSPEPPPTVRRALLQGARGNPMVLELLIADWRRRGDQCVALSLGAMTATTRSGIEVAFRRVVDHTLAALDPESRSVAELGAILGQRLNDLSMYGLVDMPMARTMRAMTSLTSHRILRDAGNAIEFANEFVRGQCYMGMAAPLRRMLHGSVADRLLAQDGPAEPIPGLEIAWHLVRADRLLEAVPYLLAGGREAIHRAAPHEAELALSTGLPALTGAARRTAILLLAEARQELGRWNESLQLLDLADEPFTESEQCCRDVFRIIARRWLGRMTLGQMAEQTDVLLEIAGREIDIETRVKALAATIRLLGLTRDAGRLERLSLLTDAIARMPMDAFQRLHVLLTSAWILANRRDTAGALATVLEGVRVADEAHVKSSIAVRMAMGHANLLCMSGRYEEAVVPLERALQLCNKLDNPTLKGECACHLALVEGRLGRSASQIAWARKALALLPANDWCASTIAAAYELGLGLVVESRFAEAQTAVLAIVALKRRGVPDWAVQGGLLCAADVVALAGKRRKAIALARRGTSGPLTSLLNTAYAGQFARWVAIIGIHDGPTASVRKRLKDALPKTDELDSKDQAEVLAAIAKLDEAGTKRTGQQWREVERRLAKLPKAVTTVMVQLGFSPTAE